MGPLHGTIRKSASNKKLGLNQLPINKVILTGLTITTHMLKDHLKVVSIRECIPSIYRGPVATCIKEKVRWEVRFPAFQICVLEILSMLLSFINAVPRGK